MDILRIRNRRIIRSGHQRIRRCIKNRNDHSQSHCQSRRPQSKGAAQKIPTLNLYPYAPQHQLAGVNAGIVPYNTVNSVGLRDQLISMAKVEARGSEEGNKGKGNPGRSGKQSRLKEIAKMIKYLRL